MASPEQLIANAEELTEQGEQQQALVAAESALATLKLRHGNNSIKILPALSLVGNIQLELGDTASAYETFKHAASIDPDGTVPEEQGGGADKFLNLSQLDETGGRASLGWFEKAVASLDREISRLESKPGAGSAGNNATEPLDSELELVVKRMKLAHALCGMCELWMTDLSFEDTAEAECESLITRAVMLLPNDAQTLQTLASIRLSQERIEEAQAALGQSLELWTDLPPSHPLVPEYAVRISLARTLMAAGMLADALNVCERLVGEEDQSVEAWYLGGWCQNIMAQDDDDEEEDGDDTEVTEGNGEKTKTSSNAKTRDTKDTEMDGADDADDDDDDEYDQLSPEEKKALLLSSREWLRNCLKLCALLKYEDDRLKEHATELVATLDQELGDAEIDEEEEWEGIHSDDDEEEGGGGGDEMDES